MNATKIEGKIAEEISRIKHQPKQEAGFLGTDAEFAAKAADLILGADADQFEGLATALSEFCSDYYKDEDFGGDRAYQEAAVHFAAAAKALAGRSGN